MNFFAAAFLAIQLNFNDGKEHDFFMINQWFSVLPGQCFVDYINGERNYFVWVSFPVGKQKEAIKEGTKQALLLCNQKCSKFAVICNL